MSAVVGSAVQSVSGVPDKLGPEVFNLPCEARKRIGLRAWREPRMPAELEVCITSDGTSNLPEQLITNKAVLEFLNHAGYLRLRYEDSITKVCMHFVFMSDIKSNQNDTQWFQFKRENDGYEIAVSIL